MSRAQLAVAQRAGAKVKVEPKTVEIVGIGELLSSLKEMQAQQANVTELVKRTLVLLLNRTEQSPKEALALADGIKELGKSLLLHAERPVYVFVAERTATGFKIEATPEVRVRH